MRKLSLCKLRLCRRIAQKEKREVRGSTKKRGPRLRLQNVETKKYINEMNKMISKGMNDSWADYEYQPLDYKLTGFTRAPSSQGRAFNEFLYKHRGRFYFEPSCDECHGLLRYDEHNELVCTKCNAVQKNIDYTIFMNASWIDEKSGDDDAWRVKTFENGYDNFKTNNKTVSIRGQSIAKNQWELWRIESGSFEKQGIKLKGETRGIYNQDKIRRQIHRVCADIGCNLKQLKNSTILQHRFRARFGEIYETLSKQGLASKIKAFERRNS